MKNSYLTKISSAFIVSAAGALMLACGSSSNTKAPTVTGAVANTSNPLVAQYSVTSGCAGYAMVVFGPDTSYGRNTNWVQVSPNQKADILVAGMRASTTYHMRAQTICSGTKETAMTTDTTFKTGALPSSIPFPQMTVSRPSGSSASAESPGIELVDIIQSVNSSEMEAFFTDRDANPIWYYDVGKNSYPFTMKLLPNGHVILTIDSNLGSILREVDLAGNTIREMDIPTLAGKSLAAGFDFLPLYYHHDICPLPNGHLLVLAQIFKNFTDLPGYPGTIQVASDALIDLDENWNPVWGWNSFDHLDINRHLYGLPDWTHSNAVVYLPSDGNVLVSMRHQSWVLKIDYANGKGTGNVLWRLGYQGDFDLTQNGVPSTDPSLWFSFQHFPSIVNQDGSQTTLTIWDNGDYRVTDSKGDVCQGINCYSRAVVFQYDESSMVADLMWQDLPELYSLWGGSINQLQNKDVEFDANAAIGVTFASEIQEVTQTSTPQTVWKMDIAPPSNAYRAYRVPSLYPGVTWQY